MSCEPRFSSPQGKRLCPQSSQVPSLLCSSCLAASLFPRSCHFLLFPFFFSVCSHSPFIVGWIVLCISSLFLCQSDTSCRSAAEYWTVTVVLTLVRLFLKQNSFPLGVQPSESITACIFYPKHSSVPTELSLQPSPRRCRGHGYTLLYRNTHCWVYLQSVWKPCNQAFVVLAPALKPLTQFGKGGNASADRVMCKERHTRSFPRRMS